MAKPITHALSSAAKFGGRASDYIEIHDFLDSSKAVFPDNRHRALTHNSWFVWIVERVFGHTVRVIVRHDYDDDGVPRPKTKEVSVRAICEQHILEDFGGKWIPTPQDYLEGMELQPWMNNGIEGKPASQRKTKRQKGMLLD